MGLWKSGLFHNLSEARSVREEMFISQQVNNRLRNSDVRRFFPQGSVTAIEENSFKLKVQASEYNRFLGYECATG